jgi:hypothetical protein
VGAGVVIRPRRGNAQVGHRAEQVERVHAAAHDAGCFRVLQEHCQGRAGVFVKVGRQGTVGGVARVQGRRESVFRGDELRVALKPELERLVGVMGRG